MLPTDRLSTGERLLLLLILGSAGAVLGWYVWTGSGGFYTLSYWWGLEQLQELKQWLSFWRLEHLTDIRGHREPLKQVLLVSCFQLWGLAWLPQLAMQTALHLASGAALYRLLRVSGGSVLAAAMAAAWQVAHPAAAALHTYAIAQHHVFGRTLVMLLCAEVLARARRGRLPGLGWLVGMLVAMLTTDQGSLLALLLAGYALLALLGPEWTRRGRWAMLIVLLGVGAMQVGLTLLRLSYRPPVGVFRLSQQLVAESLAHQGRLLGAPVALLLALSVGLALAWLLGKLKLPGELLCAPLLWLLVTMLPQAFFSLYRTEYEAHFTCVALAMLGGVLLDTLRRTVPAAPRLQVGVGVLVVGLAGVNVASAWQPQLVRVRGVRLARTLGDIQAATGWQRRGPGGRSGSWWTVNLPGQADAEPVCFVADTTRPELSQWWQDSGAGFAFSAVFLRVGEVRLVAPGAEQTCPEVAWVFAVGPEGELSLLRRP